MQTTYLNILRSKGGKDFVNRFKEKNKYDGPSKS